MIVCFSPVCSPRSLWTYSAEVVDSQSGIPSYNTKKRFSVVCSRVEEELFAVSTHSWEERRKIYKIFLYRLPRPGSVFGTHTRVVEVASSSSETMCELPRAVRSF